MEKVILPSGNVVPALGEQKLWLELMYKLWGSRDLFFEKRYQRVIRKLRKWDISTSGISRFVQHGIARKELSQKELNRRAWRLEKQFNRDRCKVNNTKARKWACTMQNRWERRDVKKLIKNGKYDQLFRRNEPRDTWMWD